MSSENLSSWIGTDAPARMIRRPRGLRVRRSFWISGDREVLPLCGMTNSHLFFSARKLERMGVEYRTERLMELTRAEKSGLDRFNQKISPARVKELTEAISIMPLQQFVLQEYPIWADLLKELERRGMKLNRAADALQAKVDYQQEQRESGWAWRRI